MEGKKKQEFYDRLQRIAWRAADQKKYTTCAIRQIEKIDGLQNNEIIKRAIEELKLHRKKLDIL